MLRPHFHHGLLAAALVAMLPLAALADQLDTLVGRRLTDVQVLAGDVPVGDLAVLGLVETRVGEPLAMADVRQTIDHLVTLGRYADIRVFGEVDGEGVRLRYGLVPLDRIVRVRFRGGLDIDADELRDVLDEQFDAAPPASQSDDMARALEARYHARGYAQARVDLRLSPAGRPGEVEAVVTATPGPRTVVGRVTTEGDATEDLVERLGLAPGRPLDRETLDARVQAATDGFRDERHYEAVVTTTVDEASPGVADVRVRATLGDRVEVEFTGDQLPASRRRSLVPIEQLRSVDEEVIEDASRNIEQYLRLEGYRLAEAPAVRRRDTGLLTITFNVRRGPLHELESLNVDGVAQIPLEEVEGLLKLQAGEAYVDARVATVAAALAELYRVRGFAAVRVSPRVTTGALAEGRVPVRVRLEVAEGPHTSVTEVSFEGATALTATELLESVALVTGKPYYRPQQTIDRAAIERRYRNLGYQRAVIEVRETPTEDASGVALTYVVREGPQTRVDHVLVSGTERISPDVVRREVALQPGQPLGYDALLESQQRLSALGLFRRVRITEAPYGAEDAVRDVLVEVEEAPSTTATYGVGVEMGQLAATGEGGAVEDRIYAAPRGFFEITRRNLWGKNRSLSLLTSVSLRPTEPGVNVNATAAQWQYGFNQYRLVGTFREPRAFNTVGDAQLSAYVERGVRSSFNFNRRGVRADYARRFPNRVVALGRYAYEHTELFDTKISIADQPLVDRLFPQVRLSTIFGSLIRDTRNDIIDPERGSVVGGELDTALRVLGSEVGFVKGFAQAFLYRKLPGTRPFVVAAGARLGLARAFQQENLPIDPSLLPPDGEPSVEVLTNLLPASERFFAGGDTTVRGFALDRLGTEETLNAFGFPTGGNAMLVANLELRTPYVKGVALVGFVDAGNVFLRASDLDLTEIRTAAGFGIRYRSPLGPLRVDVGFKLDRQELIPGVEHRVVYHLSIGQAF